MEKRIRSKVVDYIPRQLESGVIYISYLNEVAIHECICGCGNEVVTPLSKKNGWIIKEDDQGVTLYPSIGNYAFQCKSHYWIRNGQVIWIGKKKSQNALIACIRDLLLKLKKFI